jgi:hypothetical protein
MNASPETGWQTTTHQGESSARPSAREWDDSTTTRIDVATALEIIGTPAAQAPKGRPTPQRKHNARKHPTAYWKGPQLMTALAAAGWGPLGGGPSSRALTAVLDALVTKVLDHRSARGRAVVDDIAVAARYCEDYTATKLRELEDLELLVWRRADMVRKRRGGRTQSWFEVSKGRLVDLILEGRGVRDAERTERIDATRTRMAELRERWAQAARERALRRRKAWSQQAEGPADIPFASLTEVSEATASGGRQPPHPPPDAIWTQIRAAKERRRRT